MLTASSSIIGNLYIDTINANILINGVDKYSYATNVATGANIAISRRIVNYMEPPVTLYQVKFDSAIASNVYIPIGKWDMQNKVIGSAEITTEPTLLTKEIKTQVTSFNNSFKSLTLSPMFGQVRLLSTKITSSLVGMQTSMKMPALKTSMSAWTGGFAPKKTSQLMLNKYLQTKLPAKYISGSTTVVNKPFTPNLYLTQSIFKNKNIQSNFSSITTFAKSTIFKSTLNSTYTFLKSTAFKTAIGTNYAFIRSPPYRPTLGTTYSIFKSPAFQSTSNSNYAFLKSPAYQSTSNSNYAFLKSPAYQSSLNATYAFLKSPAYQSSLNATYAFLKSIPYVSMPGSNFALLKSKPIEAKAIEKYSVLVSSTYKSSMAMPYSVVKGNNYNPSMNTNYSYYKSASRIAIANTNYSIFKSLKFVTSNGSSYSYLPIPKLSTTLVTPYTYRGPAPFKPYYTFTTEQTVKLFDTSSTVAETLAKAPRNDSVSESIYTVGNSKKIKPAINFGGTVLSANVVAKLISPLVEMYHAPDPLSTAAETELKSVSATAGFDIKNIVLQDVLPELDVENIVLQGVLSEFDVENIVLQDLSPVMNNENTVSDFITTELDGETETGFQSFPMEIDVEHLVYQDLPAEPDIETVLKYNMPVIDVDIEHLVLPSLLAELENEHLIPQDLPAVADFDPLKFSNTLPIEREEPEYFLLPDLPAELESEHLIPQDLPAVADFDPLVISDTFSLEIEIEHLVPNALDPVLETEHLVPDTIPPVLDAEHLVNSSLILELDQEIFWGTDQIDIGGAVSTYISIFADARKGRGLVNSTADLLMVEYTKEYTYIDDKAYLTHFDAFDKASKYYAADAVRIATTDYWNYRIYFNEHHFCVPKKGRIFPVTWYIQGG